MYNVILLLLFLIALPKWIWEALCYQKHRRSLLEKLGLKIPQFHFTKSGPRIWIHSISMGETKAVAPLIARLQEKYPDASIVVSTVSDTGQDEAKRSIHADQIFYFPLDFSWTIRKLMHRIKPSLVILVEGDFWYNLITQAPHVALVNGKISEKSFSRFKKVPFFSRKIFSKISLYCLQSARFQERFVHLSADPHNIVITGNLKFDQPFPHIDRNEWKQKLSLAPSDRVLTIGSTHAPEEEMLLDAISPLQTKFPNLKVLLVPRHPERFPEVRALLEKKGIDFDLFSSPSKNPHHRVVLVDAMGVLSACYQLSELAIVGGSFIPTVGGHNIFEPAAIGVPVLFGPSMYSQKDLVELVTHAGAGRQVSLDELPTTLDELLSYPSKAMSHAGLRLADEVHGSTARTLEAIGRILK